MKVHFQHQSQLEHKSDVHKTILYNHMEETILTKVNHKWDKNKINHNKSNKIGLDLGKFIFKKIPIRCHFQRWPHDLDMSRSSSSSATVSMVVALGAVTQVLTSKGLASRVGQLETNKA